MNCLIAALGLMLLHAAPAPDDRAALRARIDESIRQGAAEAKTTPADASDTVMRWSQQNASALDGVSRSTLADQPWGLSATRLAARADEPSRVYLYVFDWHVSGKL